MEKAPIYWHLGAVTKAPGYAGGIFTYRQLLTVKPKRSIFTAGVLAPRSARGPLLVPS